MSWDGKDQTAPEGQVFVCGACGRVAKTRYGMKDDSCILWATLCHEEKNPDGTYRAVEEKVA
jgi:hypothetical protein